MKIAIVGNGPISRRDGRLIDCHDVVMRFNNAWHCGVHGRRTDVLAMAKLHKIELWQFNERSLAAREIWSMRPLDDGRSGQRAIVGKPVTVMDPSVTAAALAAFKTAEDKSPSTGSAAIAHVLHHFPNASISLFGFSHSGAIAHDWQAERDWCESLERGGRLTHFRSADGPLAALGLALEIKIHLTLASLRRSLLRARTKRSRATAQRQHEL